MPDSHPTPDAAGIPPAPTSETAAEAKGGPHAARLAALRAGLRRDGLDAYLIGVQDESLGEYPPPHRARLTWLSGYAGSAGWAVVTETRTALFVDGRYTLQVRRQVDTETYETHNSAETGPMAWLGGVLADRAAPKLGYDPWLIAEAQAKRWAAALETAAGQPVSWVADAGNRLDALWNAEGGRPADPRAPAFLWKQEHAGAGRAEKEGVLAAALRAAELDAALLTNPESPCWLLNLRGGDLPTTPILRCAALARLAGEGLRLQLFVDGAKLSARLREDALAEVEILPESALTGALMALPPGVRLGCDAASTPRAATLALEQAGIDWVKAEDPCLLPRACKHPVEQGGMREAHRRDGIAMVRFLHWLERHLAEAAPERWPTEMEIGERLLGFRREAPDFRGPSFDTIAGFGANGAIVHYRAETETALRLAPGGLLLLDSGGQYPMGTTDITRTLFLAGGPMDGPEARHREDYTRVLAGHLALGMARFPQGTTGSQLDALARAPLWEVGKDYDHGTGHGVGTFLNVHEGPQRISKRAGDAVALRPGMVVSNEPGHYAAGSHGIRIENLVMVREAETEGFLRFEPLTCVPHDRRLVLPELLTPQARAGLNAYHAWVWETLEADVAPEARAWLAAACEAI